MSYWTKRRKLNKEVNVILQRIRDKDESSTHNSNGKHMESLAPSAEPVAHKPSSATVDGSIIAYSLVEDIVQSSACGLLDGTSSPDSESSDSELFDSTSDEECTDTTELKSQNQFQKRLAVWATTQDIPAKAVDSLLSLLRECGHPSLPKNSKRLLSTPKTRSYDVTKVAGGQYFQNSRRVRKRYNFFDDDSDDGTVPKATKTTSVRLPSSLQSLTPPLPVPPPSPFTHFSENSHTPSASEATSQELGPSVATPGPSAVPSAISVELLKKVLDIQETQKYHTKLLQGLTKSNAKIGLEETGIEIPLPLKTPEQLAELEELLFDKSKQHALVSQLSVLGGSDNKETVHRLLRAVVTVELSQKINWSGKGGKNKTAFQSLNMLCSVLLKAARRNPLSRALTEAEFGSIAQKWLRGAADRGGGRHMRMLNKHRRVSAERSVNESDSDIDSEDNSSQVTTPNHSSAAVSGVE